MNSFCPAAPKNLTNKRIYSTFISLTILSFSAFPAPVFADWIKPREVYIHTEYRTYNPEFFPFCPVTRGYTQAFYHTGTHAIVGDPVIKTGSDIVFGIGNNNYVQCYCPAEGENGIQTNWLSTGSFPPNDVDRLKNEDWYFISDGSDWGLSAQPYLAKNSPFLCLRPLFDVNDKYLAP